MFFSKNINNYPYICKSMLGCLPQNTSVNSPNYILVVTSALFLIPGGYAYYKHLYGMSTVIVVTSIVSMNYWRHPVPSLRKTCDLLCSKTCFVIMVYQGIRHVHYRPYLIASYPILGIMITSFFLSNWLYNRGNKYWYMFHIVFHMSIVANKTMIVDSLYP